MKDGCLTLNLPRHEATTQVQTGRLNHYGYSLKILQTLDAIALQNWIVLAFR